MQHTGRGRKVEQQGQQGGAEAGQEEGGSQAGGGGRGGSINGDRPPASASAPECQDWS